MSRVLYTLKMAMRYRRHLKHCRLKHGFMVPRVIDINLKRLCHRGVKVLVLDFDGVLAPHGEVALKKEIVIWLKVAAEIFGEGRIYILSNKPMASRKAYFQKHFPNMTFIDGVRKKPYPDGLLKIIALSQMPAEAHVLVDDRLLTGILATQIAGTQGILISSPFQQLQKRFVQECFFSFLRFAERLLF